MLGEVLHSFFWLKRDRSFQLGCKVSRNCGADLDGRCQRCGQWRNSPPAAQRTQKLIEYTARQAVQPRRTVGKEVAVRGHSQSKEWERWEWMEFSLFWQLCLVVAHWLVRPYGCFEMGYLMSLLAGSLVVRGHCGPLDLTQVTVAEACCLKAASTKRFLLLYLRFLPNRSWTQRVLDFLRVDTGTPTFHGVGEGEVDREMFWFVISMWQNCQPIVLLFGPVREYVSVDSLIETKWPAACFLNKGGLSTGKLQNLHVLPFVTCNFPSAKGHTDLAALAQLK